MFSCRDFDHDKNWIVHSRNPDKLHVCLNGVRKYRTTRKTCGFKDATQARSQDFSWGWGGGAFEQ